MGLARCPVRNATTPDKSCALNAAVADVSPNGGLCVTNADAIGAGARVATRIRVWMAVAMSPAPSATGAESRPAQGATEAAWTHRVRVYSCAICSVRAGNDDRSADWDVDSANCRLG